MSWRALFAAAAAMLLGSGDTTAQERAALGLLVPAYFYPTPAGSDWRRLVDAARAGARVTAIMNPASGPGPRRNPDYARAIAALRAAGGTVLGYVPSGYLGTRVDAGSSCRPASGLRYTPNDVIACALAYRAFYGEAALDGVFIDEMGPPAQSASESEIRTFYGAVCRGVRQAAPAWKIFGNPGTLPPPALLRSDDADHASTPDALVVFENVAARFADQAVATRVLPGSKGGQSLGALLIERDGGVTAMAALARAAELGYAHAYVTERRRPNPYDRLPADFEAQVAEVVRINAGRAARPDAR